MAGGREGEGADLRNRISALVLIVPLLALGAESSPPKDTQPGDWSRVPKEIRKQLHTSSDQVPLYPENDPRLMKVGLWPKSREFDGQDYDLEYSAWRSDAVRTGLRSLSDIDPGWVYGARYVRYSRNEKYGSKRGPYYEWYPDSTLYQRSFFTAASSWHSWYYDRQGNLRTYDVSIRGSGCDPGCLSTELFSTGGTLVGCEFPRLKKYYWMGSEIQSDEYFRRLNIFNKWQ